MKKIKIQCLLLVTMSLTVTASAESLSQIQPILPVKEINLAQSELGKKLFFDPRLSKSGFISCNSCHNLSMGGTDNLKTSIGHKWQKGPINSPTVLNSSLNIAQFWDGRAADLKAQAGGPIANPGEMALTHSLAIDVLESIPGYVTAFKLAFNTTDSKITFDQVTDVIAEFEKTLVTPNSRFDQYLLGNENAITDFEKKGFKLFKFKGCASCHSGRSLGGSNFLKMGLFKPYKTQNPAKGVYSVTGKDADRFKFKVPTLRNIELTYPYFHDGEAQTLTEAVDIMGRLQLGTKFSEEENAQIVAFLKTLTGDQPSFTLPILPPSSDETLRPKPFD